MKRRTRIALVFFVLAAIGIFIFVDERSVPRPVLVLKGYEISKANGGQVAKLELQNTTKKSIWLLSDGDWGSPLSPSLLERPVVAPLNAASNSGPEVYSVRVGSFIITREELRRGANRIFDYRLIPGKPPVQLGISYYVGNIKNIGDFFEPVLQGNASLKDKLRYYWERFKRPFSGPKEYEVWCPQPVSFKENAPTNGMPPTEDTH